MLAHELFASLGEARHLEVVRADELAADALLAAFVALVDALVALPAAFDSDVAAFVSLVAAALSEAEAADANLKRKNEKCWSLFNYSINKINLKS